MDGHCRWMYPQSPCAGARDAAGRIGDRRRRRGRGAGDGDAQNLQGAYQHRGKFTSQARAVHLDAHPLQIPPWHGGSGVLAGERLGTGDCARVWGDGLYVHAVSRLRAGRNGNH